MNCPSKFSTSTFALHFTINLFVCPEMISQAMGRKFEESLNQGLFEQNVR